MTALSSLPPWADALAGVLIVVGAAFALIGAFGVAKLRTFELRLHGPSKASTLGAGCVLAASALWFGLHGEPSGRELLVVLFLFCTAPAASQLLVQAALRLDDSAARPPPAPPPPAAPPG